MTDPVASQTSRARLSLILTLFLACGLVAPAVALAPALVAPLGVTAGLTALVGMGAVPLLRRLKTGQFIREDGPQSHFSKAGTPTMGGLYFVLVGLAVALIWSQANPAVVAVSAVTLASGLVGWLDDWQVIRKQSNKGITPRQKLLLQLVIAVAFCGWLFHLGIPLTVTLPGVGVLSLGWAFWILAIFTLLGTNNAVNLTDGLDGLAAGVVAIVLMCLGLLQGDSHLAIFCACLSGSCLGFLAHNRYPARVFMGDTGSLGLGGALASVALISNSLWALALVGAVFVAEAVSVMMQVSYFKFTKRRTGEGKRLFRMAPLHHHLELGGWSEVRIVSTLYTVTAVLAVVGWLCFHLLGV